VSFHRGDCADEDRHLQNSHNHDNYDGSDDDDNDDDHDDDNDNIIIPTCSNSTLHPGRNSIPLSDTFIYRNMRVTLID